MRCQDLEVQITTLELSAYSDKAGFYSDAAHGAAIWGGMLWAPALGYLGYSGLVEYRQRQRMADAQARIEHLRLLKAQRHCYE